MRGRRSLKPDAGYCPWRGECPQKSGAMGWRTRLPVFFPLEEHMGSRSRAGTARQSAAEVTGSVK